MVVGVDGWVVASCCSAFGVVVCRRGRLQRVAQDSSSCSSSSSSEYMEKVFGFDADDEEDSG